MIFNSFEFIFFFLPIVYILFRLIIKKSYRIGIMFLTLASLFYYAWWNHKFLILIVLSICINYVWAILITRAKPESYIRRYLLFSGIALNLVGIAYFKYANFILESFNGVFNLKFAHLDIVLPLAISFFTFQQITYLVDTHKGIISKHGFLYYCLYVTFFPQLIAGPIVHHKEVLPQFKSKRPQYASYDEISKGMIYFLIGLAKKVIIADYLATIASPVFEAAKDVNPLNIFEVWGGALAYTFQLYFDFSGYSDMAIGIALLFGIVLPLNFNSPYKARSLIDFWRRWHITLSTFLRDYLYIPLGGNRKGEIKRYRNLLYTMILGGLWHGAGWTFIIWGGIHGIGLTINHLWIAAQKKYEIVIPSTYVTRTLFCLVTFLCVVISWVFFRAESIYSASNILSSMFTNKGLQSDTMNLFSSTKAIALIGLSGFIVWTFPNTYELLENRKQQPLNPSLKPFKIIHVVGASLLAIISLLLFLTNREPEFLYYDF